MFHFIQLIDDFILLFIQSHLHCGFFDSFFVLITRLGNGGIIWITFGILLFCSKKYRKYGIIILLSLLFSNMLGEQILKPLVARIRPCNVNKNIELLITKPHAYSFPSGHAMTSFTAATVLYYMNKKCGRFAYILAALIGFSRLYLYVHYPTDVLIGGILGVTTALFVIHTFDTSFIEIHNSSFESKV